MSDYFTAKAYEGREPFVFISYAHKDTDIVLPVIQGLQNRGVRVWYDGGLELTDQWLKRIADRLEKCSCVLAFASRNFSESDNCYKEVHFAVEEKKGIAVVYLDPVEKLNAQTRMQLGPLHALFYDRYPRIEALLDALMKVPALGPCIGGTGDAASAVSGAADYSFWDNPEAWYSRGMQYFQAENYTEAVAWFRKAADQGHGKAQYQMGVCCEKGLGTELNRGSALMWYRKAKAKGESQAQPAIDRIETLFRPGARDACRKADRLYEQGNYEEAAAWFRKAAQWGDAEAQFRLAECYISGDGVRKSYADAAYWYLKAAERGYVEAQYIVSNQYLCGLYLWEDRNEREKECAKWLGRAAVQGHAQAQYTMGCRYSRGTDTRKDDGKAVLWFRRAAAQGHAKAQYELGECYYFGRGIPKDLDEAAALYSKAADKGYAPAQYSLGWCYEHGQGVGKDEKEALQWYRKAADQGYLAALRNMGLCCEYGIGCSRNLKYALAWYQKAKESKYEGIDEDIARCRKKRIFPWIK